MGWLKRSGSDRAPKPAKRAAAPFWHELPLRTSDPDVLHQAGIDAYVRDDGPSMMRAGWALWNLGGLHEHQTVDFLRDGLTNWRRSDHCGPPGERMFLDECFERVRGSGPSAPPNIYQAPPEAVAPAAAYQGFRCYIASELVEVLGRDDPAALDERAPELYEAISSSLVDFVPPRSMQWARAYATSHNLPAPWSAQG
jgi:hypothetical protein